MASRTPAQPPPPIRLTPLPARQRTGGRDLPASLTSLIGRDELIATLAASLRGNVRLLTLTGPGGVGKTRLALAVAAAAADSFADGVAFVPLAPVRDPQSFAPAVAQTLQIPQRLDHPAFEDVKEALRDEHLLLVLDNFEHLNAVAPLLTDLLQSCPRLSLLVTSRVRLHLTGEHEVPVPLLPTPDVAEQSSASDLRHNPSARLFEERAAATLPGFTITDQDAQAVAAICHRLDGLPLAIELAAARTIVLTPPALLARLDQRLPVLTGGPVDAPERLRTMRDAVAWSYDLLSADEQTLFRHLAVFVSGFSLEAAEAVSLDPTVLDGLTALIEASLVQRAIVDGDEARFGMLETVREFAAERLAESGERDAVFGRLTDWCLVLVGEAERTIRGAEQARWFRRFELEQNNLKAAIGWALGTGKAETALRLINGPLWYFWSMRGWARSERPWLERAISLAVTDPARVDPHVLARAYLSDGLFFLQTGGYQESRDRFEASLALYRGLGDDGRGGAAMALGNLATLDNDQGDYVRAGERLDQALAIRRVLGAPLPIALTLINLGNVANLRGEHGTAMRLLDEALPLLRESGDPRAIAFCLTNLGEATAGLGHDAQALAFFEQALVQFGQFGDPNGEGFVYVDVAASAVRLGDPSRAATALARALTIQRDVRNPVVVADALDSTAEVALATGRPEVAPRFLAAAAAIRDSTQTMPSPVARRRTERVTAAARAALGRGPFEAATMSGRASATEETLEAALAFLTEVGGDGQPVVQAGGDTPAHVTPGTLTTRQRDVLRLLVDGLSDPEIAAALNLSTRTVETHVAGILNKLGLHSRTAAVAYAVRHRLV